MARRFHRSAFRQLLDAFVRLGLHFGLVPKDIYLLTVRGRRSGRLHATPVTLVQAQGARWLVSPYGEVSWVKNARVAGWASLAKGNRADIVGLDELGPADAAPVLKAYLRHVPIVRPYFDVTPDSPLEAFAVEAPRHPVFRVVAPPGPESIAGEPVEEARS